MAAWSGAKRGNWQGARIAYPLKDKTNVLVAHLSRLGAEPAGAQGGRWRRQGEGKVARRNE